MTLIFDALTSIPIKTTAAGSNLSTECLARLARTGRVRARITGGMWFLEMHSLRQFLSIRAPTTEATPIAAASTRS